MVEEEKSEGDVFTEAFDTLAKTGELPAPVALAAEAPAEQEKVDVSDTEASERSGDEVGGSDVEAPASDEAASNEPVQAETPAPKEPEKAPADQDIIDRLAQAVKDRVQPVQVPQEPQSQPEYQPQPVLTQEDYKQLEAFEKDWPDVAKAMDLRAKEQAHAIVNHIFKEFAQEFRPVAQQVMAMRQQMHVQELHTRVSDYEDVRDKVVEWANSQPDYLRSAYQQVIMRGSPAQVQDLINRYRQETAPPPAAAPAPAPAQPKPLPPAVKKAAEKLAPVQSKRSNVVRGDDPNDFDGAFEQWAKAQ